MPRRPASPRASAPQPASAAGAPRRTAAPSHDPAGDKGLAPRQRRLLDELEAVFLAQGFRAVTVAELAQRLRCSRRAFYELADSKEALFLRVFDRYLARLRDEGRRGAQVAQPAEAFEPYLRPAIDAARKLSAAVMSDITGYAPANAMWERHQRERLRGLRALVQRCVDDGIFRGVHARLVAEVMAASLRRIREPDFLAESGLSYREAVEELYAMLLYGLFRREPGQAPTIRAGSHSAISGNATTSASLTKSVATKGATPR